MPKPFLLGIEVEEPALGAVLRKLDGLPGVIKLHMDFRAKPPSGAKHKYNGGVPRRGFGEPGYVFLAKAAKRNELTARQMREAFEAAGRKPGSVASSHHNARKHGLIVKGKAKGTWAATKNVDKLIAAIMGET